MAVGMETVAEKVRVHGLHGPVGIAPVPGPVLPAPLPFSDGNHGSIVPWRTSVQDRRSPQWRE
ncbi:hypothetical protein GCM10009576_036530 [Streptomyces rhizosphaericus]|uniref:Uncharacterized protein n=2 Tax=Streptomyces rhizosphaericus TaxID=114699 RepID=A0ABN1S9M1_9ACTN